MDKIELRIMGGLGNQLYQYSAAKIIQKEYDYPRIDIDTGEYDTYKVRNLELNNLIHSENINFINPSSNSFLWYTIRLFYRIYQRLYHDITRKHAKQKCFKFGKNNYLCSSTEFVFPNNLNCNNLYLYGYFVSSSNAICIKKDLMNEVFLNSYENYDKYNYFLNMIKKTNTIGVSIRCADDYVLNGWPVCSKQFYINGIDIISKMKNYDDSDINIMIFADDIKKIKSEKWFIGFKNVTYIENVSVCESFQLLRNCNDYVCSNSSFSWWGAFLSYSDNPIIINPNKVFAGENAVDDNNTFYEDMILLDYLEGTRIN